MAERIPRKPEELSQHCAPAASAIGAVPTWPPAAPSAATTTTWTSNQVNLSLGYGILTIVSPKEVRFDE